MNPRKAPVADLWTQLHGGLSWPTLRVSRFTSVALNHRVVEAILTGLLIEPVVAARWTGFIGLGTLMQVAAIEVCDWDPSVVVGVLHITRDAQGHLVDLLAAERPVVLEAVLRAMAYPLLATGTYAPGSVSQEQWWGIVAEAAEAVAQGAHTPAQAAQMRYADALLAHLEAVPSPAAGPSGLSGSAGR